MDEQKIHTGHRQRMNDRVLQYPDSLSDHELLEMLLYSVIPRTDTNPLAHRILNEFGSIDRVFSAEASELMCVSGVGEKVAAKIILTGKIFRRVKEAEKTVLYLNSTDKIMAECRKRFETNQSENFLVLLLKEDKRLCSQFFINGYSEESVELDTSELVKKLALLRPTYLVVAHNHPSGNATPSNSDDLSTRKLDSICRLHSVRLLDHIIFSENNCYSYYMSGRLLRLKAMNENNGF